MVFSQNWKAFGKQGQKFNKFVPCIKGCFWVILKIHLKERGGLYESSTAGFGLSERDR